MTDKTGATDLQELLDIVKKCQHTIESALGFGEGKTSEFQVNQVPNVKNTVTKEAEANEVLTQLPLARNKQDILAARREQALQIREDAKAKFLENQKMFAESREKFIQRRT